MSTTLSSMIHYDITMGNDIAGDIHGDVTMSIVAMCTYHDITIHNGITMSFFYYELLLPIMILMFPFKFVHKTLNQYQIHSSIA